MEYDKIWRHNFGRRLLVGLLVKIKTFENRLLGELIEKNEEVWKL